MEGHIANQESIGTILRAVLMDLRALIHEEIALARVEIRQQAGRAKAAAVSLGIAAASLAFGATFLLIAIALGIADAFDWPVWAGFGAVAVVMSVAGLAAYASGQKRLQKVHTVPEETVATLKENSEWITKRLSSALK
jgi:uncharacterized membrane protein YqjE